MRAQIIFFLFIFLAFRIFFQSFTEITAYFNILAQVMYGIVPSCELAIQKPVRTKTPHFLCISFFTFLSTTLLSTTALHCSPLT